MSKIMCEVLATTDKARLIRVKNGGQIWVPESVITSSVLKAKSFGKSEGHIVVEDWWSEKVVQELENNG